MKQCIINILLILAIFHLFIVNGFAQSNLHVEPLQLITDGGTIECGDSKGWYVRDVLENNTRPLDITCKFKLEHKAHVTLNYLESSGASEKIVRFLSMTNTTTGKFYDYYDKCFYRGGGGIDISFVLDPGEYVFKSECPDGSYNLFYNFTVDCENIPDIPQGPTPSNSAIDLGLIECGKTKGKALFYGEENDIPLKITCSFSLAQKALVKFNYIELSDNILDIIDFSPIKNMTTNQFYNYYDKYEDHDGYGYGNTMSFLLDPGEYVFKSECPDGSYNLYYNFTVDCENIPEEEGGADPDDPDNPNPEEPEAPILPNVPVSTITYDYNIRSWVTNISSLDFNQQIYYNQRTGSNTSQYNGNISATSWDRGSNTPSRSYIFVYDQLSRLTKASYKGANDKEKYGTSYSYDKHGNMLALERAGKINNDGTPDSYGVIDQLAFAYNGNQLKAITDTGANVMINESADFKGNATGDTHYTFNRNGAMTQDLNKGITNIEYNSLNLPISMDISIGMNLGRNEYLYTASGVKLQVKHSWNKDQTTAATLGSGMISNEMDTTKVTDYVGNKIYENGELKKILVDGGYYDCEKEEYFFYIQDHLGNNRVVVNQKDSVVQRSNYYPFGMGFADNEGNDQPYKYNGKELDTMLGLNMYDYSARYVDPTYGRFTTVDPKAEKYYSISPYAYCGNNPIRLVDVDGKEWGIVVNANGTMTVTLNVGFSVSSNLNLTTAQIDSYKAAISSQLNSTFMEASGGLISATMSFDGGKDPNRFTPEIVLSEFPEGYLGSFIGAAGPRIPLAVNNASNNIELGETGVHELFHTLTLPDAGLSSKISDVRLVESVGTYTASPAMEKSLRKNIMLYSSNRINGRSYWDIYKTFSGMNQITPGQLRELIKNIYKQMGGYGVIPKQKENETREEYEKRAAEYFHEYWNPDNW